MVKYACSDVITDQIISYLKLNITNLEVHENTWLDVLEDELDQTFYPVVEKGHH